MASPRRGRRRQVAENDQWPVWTAPPADTPHLDGYGGIACYVAPLLIEQRISHAFPRGLRGRLARAESMLPTVDRLVAHSLWKALANKAIPYTAPPWHPMAGQRIRDPEWLWQNEGSGTCIDLAALLAGACLKEELDTFLIMLRGPEIAHAAVAVRLGTSPLSAQMPPGVERCAEEPGVGVLVDRNAFVASDEMLLLDPTTATEESTDTSPQHSTRILAELLADPRFTSIHLVSVGVRQRFGDREFPAPLRRGALRTQLSAPDLRTTLDFPAHTRARAQLARKSGGAVVLHGAEGTGKSTLARLFAAGADEGFGWFLSGATLGSYRTSLARAEIAERGEELITSDNDLSSELARSAQDRLAREGGGWVVVIDNANDGPQELRDLPVPRNDSGQLLIVTTTSDPSHWPGFEPISLDPTPDELEKGPSEFGTITAGNPLLVAAFTALHSVSPSSVPESLERPVGDVNEGARLYWKGVQDAAPSVIKPCVLDLAERLALLPPDTITAPLAHELGDGVADLLQIGLLTRLTDGTLSMHRMLGRTVQSTDTDPQHAATDVLASDSAVAALTRHGNTHATSLLAAALKDSSDGVALARLGALQELHDGLTTSLETYMRAESALKSLDPRPGSPQADALADCHHARARKVNQEPKPTTAEIATARNSAELAADLRGPDATADREKHLAMAALLRQRAAGLLPSGSPEHVAELHAVRKELDNSHRRREVMLGSTHPLVDRASFNRAGVRILLAQADRENAHHHLLEAREVYRSTLAFRRSFYADTSPLTAASEYGLGTWGYYATLLSTEASEEAFDTAFDHTLESLRIRKRLGVKNDIAKSASMLTKLALLQVMVADGSPGVVVSDATAELQARMDSDSSQ